MPRRPRIISAPPRGLPVTGVLIVPVLQRLIMDSINTIEQLYNERKPVSFTTLEAFVDCRNHLVKALTITEEKLAQLPLPEPANPKQPELPLGEKET